MAKLTKKRKKHLSRNGKFIILFIMCAFYFTISLFISASNTSLDRQIQKCNNEINTIKQENETLSSQVAQLQGKERVFEIAKEAGLEQNQDNIVSISNNNNN